MDAQENLDAVMAELAALDAEIAVELDLVSQHRAAARTLQAKRDGVLNRERVARRLAELSPQELGELNRQLSAIAAS